MQGFNSSNIVSKTKTIGRRMFLISTFKAVILLGIFGRLATLQINESSKYRSLADKNRFRETKIAPPRGIIRDYFGTEIASNQKIYQLQIEPENIPNIDQLFFKLKRIINLSDKKIYLLKKMMAKQKKWDTTTVSDNLTWSEFSRINLFLHDLQGARPVVSIARVYKDNSSAHIVGYVSEISARDLRNKKYLKNLRIKGVAIGKTGLESKLDEQMLGSPGYLRYEVNAYGKKIKQVAIEKGLEGTNFRTTLDQEIQMFAAKQLENVSGAVCVMDIYNGDVVSMVSSPTFNPNSFVHGVGTAEWKELLDNRDKPMINKATSGLYPPGSTIKTLTALSALENDTVSPKMLVHCKGYIDLHGERFHCWKKKGHGVVNLKSAMKQSCDTYFYEIARKLGVDRLKETSVKFGLGEKVLNKTFNNEKKGLIPDTKWKKNNLGKGWVIGETLITGIGQGYTQTTPLQLCQMTAQLANGGFKIYPKIIMEANSKTAEEIRLIMNENSNNLNKKNSGLQDATELLGFVNKKKHECLFKSSKNIRLVREAMFASTNEVRGTSYKSRIEDPKYQFAGKTGTSQVKRITEAARKLDLNTSEIPYNDRDHALYIAFGPYKKPRYALSIVIEHGGSGSSAAAPIAKKLFKLIIDRHELREKARIKKTIKI